MLKTILQSQAYFGRGMIVGKSANAKEAFLLYFLMGRSENSQNRLFYTQDQNVCIKAFDEKLIQDPSLIFYPPLVHFESQVILSNGDQTQSILEYLQKNQSFEEALRMREFEPDSPHFTPRISALLSFENGDFSYKMSLLKASSVQAPRCYRFFYEYPSIQGEGHFLHTYNADANPLPSFVGEPKSVKIVGSLEDFASCVWENLNSQYKVALCAQSIDLFTQETKTLIFNAKEVQC